MTPKQSLYQTIETLSDAECSKLLQIIHHWRQEVAPVLAQLAENPTFHIPSHTPAVFPKRMPIHANGPTASEQLIEERR